MVFSLVLIRALLLSALCVVLVRGVVGDGVLCLNRAD